ncbi:hypothetical protein HMPREF9622_00663 [Cutibacterium modestum HL037PA3]|nr:hypothetical protein HMPREF9621_01237 [Cutibacterium modestum HL037PA2]EFT16209.1 hypothetical protein HMPREF9622_00663 [Cutibacterium modestum HL037PA3]
MITTRTTIADEPRQCQGTRRGGSGGHEHLELAPAPPDGHKNEWNQAVGLPFSSST